MFSPMRKIMNACPRITKREVIERAGFHVKPSDGDVDAHDFAIEMMFDAAKEIGVLQPQEVREIVVEGAKVVEKEYRDRGLIVVDSNTDLTAAKIGALERAIQFYNYRGAQQLALVGMQLTEDELRRLRREYRGLYINQAREEILQEALAVLTDAPRPADPVTEEEDESEGIRENGTHYMRHRGRGRWEVIDKITNRTTLPNVTKEEAEAFLSGENS